MKHEWRKTEKTIYLPKKDPEQIKLPKIKYFTISGAANPNHRGFSEAVSALYTMSYGIKTALKKEKSLADSFDYTVYPLEGFWSLNEKGMDQFRKNKTFDKADLRFKIMIRQPDFITPDFALKIMANRSKSKPNQYNEKIKFTVIEEGLCVQAMHSGTYDTENLTFLKMNNYCADHHLERISPAHKEIYLSDPRKTVPEKNQTGLRFAVKTR